MTLAECLVAIKGYRDSFGLITQANKDGGDTANRTGSYYTFLKALNAPYDDLNRPVLSGLCEDLSKLQKWPGRYMRHPDVTQWYSNPWNFTRDQSIQLQAAMVCFSLSRKAITVFFKRLLIGLFHWNFETGDNNPATFKYTFPDPWAPIELSQFIRATDSWWCYPLLWLTDAQLYIDIRFSRATEIANGSNDFDVGYLPILLSCTGKWKTFWGDLAIRRYKSTAGVENAIRDYYQEGPGHNGLVPLGELACLAYERL